MAALDWIWYLDGKPCSHPASLTERLGPRPGADELPLWERANSVECPVGATPGSAWLLMSKDRVNKLSKAGFHTIKIVNPIETVTLKGYVFVRALSMFGQPGDAQSPMLVELQDRRAVIARSSINKAYNVRIPAPPNPSVVANRYYPESLNGQVPWTWQTMVADIWGMLTDAGAVPTIPAAPAITEPPDSLRFYGENAWYALHAALATVGLEISFDPVADKLSIVRPGTDPALAGILAGLRKRLRQDFDAPQDIHAGLVPEKIKVFFPKRSKYYGTERDTPRLANWEADPVYELELATGIAGARGTSPYNADLFALYDFAGVLTNLAELNKRANDILTSVKANLGLDRNVWIAGATAKLLPGTELTKVVWRDYGDDVGQITMAERRVPAADGGSGGGIAERPPEFDSIKPIDLGRRSHPIYPRVMQVVEVFAPDTANGPVEESIPVAGIIGAKPAFLHRGKVRLFRNGLEILEPCFLVVTKDFDKLLGNVTLRNHDVLHGRLSGTAKLGQEELPLYSVEDDGGSTGRAFFILTSNRTRKRNPDQSRYGDANATIRAIAGTIPDAVGAKIKVIFYGTHKLEAVKNCIGFADYFPSYIPYPGAAVVNEGIYIVTWCQGLPARLSFITKEDREPLTPNQDVKAVPIQNLGFNDDDLPLDQWYTASPQPPVSCGGVAVWTRGPQTGGQWVNTIPCADGCVSSQDPNQLIFPAGQTTATYPCVSNGQQGLPDFVVRFIDLEYPRALKESDGTAILDTAIESDNPDDMRYVVEVANQQALAIGWYLDKDNCNQDIITTDVEALSQWPFSQYPQFPLTVINKLKGRATDRWTAFWNDERSRYETWYMQPHEVKMMIDFKITNVNGCPKLTWKEQRADVWICSDPTAGAGLQFHQHVSVSNTKLFQDGCVIMSLAQYDIFCALGEPEPDPPWVETGRVTFTKSQATTSLEFVKGQTGSGGSGQEVCDPKLRQHQGYFLQLPGCTDGTPDPEDIVLSTRNVVVGFIEAADCVYPVYAERIDFGQCGEDFQGGAIICVDLFECPPESG